MAIFFAFTTGFLLAIVGSTIIHLSLLESSSEYRQYLNQASSEVTQ